MHPPSSFHCRPLRFYHPSSSDQNFSSSSPLCKVKDKSSLSLPRHSNLGKSSHLFNWSLAPQRPYLSHPVQFPSLSYPSAPTPPNQPDSRTVRTPFHAQSRRHTADVASETACFSRRNVGVHHEAITISLNTAGGKHLEARWQLFLGLKRECIPWSAMTEMISSWMNGVREEEGALSSERRLAFSRGSRSLS